MGYYERIGTAKGDIAEWFDWNRHRVATPSELAGELELALADVEAALSDLATAGEVVRDGTGYSCAVG